MNTYEMRWRLQDHYVGQPRPDGAQRNSGLLVRNRSAPSDQYLGSADFANVGRNKRSALRHLMAAHKLTRLRINLRSGAIKRLRPYGVYLLRRLLRRFGNIVERGDDVLGERVGERGAAVRAPQQSDPARGQGREAVTGREHAHAWPQA
jgi:hypothetical protein